MPAGHAHDAWILHKAAGFRRFFFKIEVMAAEDNPSVRIRIHLLPDIVHINRRERAVTVFLGVQVRAEIIQEDEEQSIDKLPDLDKDALITAEVSGTGTQAYGIPAGSYMVRVTVTEKAKGTVTAEIQAE